MKEWSDKNAILNFFLGTTQLLFTSNSILVRTIFHVFPNIHSKIWKFLHHLFPWERSKRYEGVMKNMRNNFFMSSIFCLKMYPPWSTAEKIGAIVSWRSSVSEDVWKGAPAPAFLRLHTTHTRNTQPLLGGGNLCLCAQYRQQLDMQNPPVIIKCRVL